MIKNDNNSPQCSKRKSSLCLENDNCWTVPMEEGIYKDNEDEDNSQICCFAGCLTGIAASVLFIFIVPLGFLLVIYGRNNNSSLYMVVGVIFLSLPLLIFVAFVTIVQCRQQTIETQQNTPIKQDNQSQRY